MTLPIDGTAHPAPIPASRPSMAPPPTRVPPGPSAKDTVTLSPEMAKSAKPNLHLAEPDVHPATQKALSTLPKTRTWAGKLPGNEGREVALIVPPGVDLRKPVTVVTYFHGWYQNLGKNLLTDRPGAPSMREAILHDARRQNAVFVVPMGSPPNVAHAGQQNQDWMRKQPDSPEPDLRTLQDQSLQKLQALWGAAGSPISVKEWVLAAHSGGGHAVHNALANYDSQDAGAPHVQQIWYLDATYERPPDLPGVSIRAIYRPRTAPGRNDTQTEAEAIRTRPGVELTYVSHTHNDIARLGLRHLLNPQAGHLGRRVLKTHR